MLENLLIKRLKHLEFEPLTDDIIKAIHANNDKEWCPLADISSLNTQEHTIVVADFDNLPEGFGSYEELYGYFLNKYYNVSRTASNKVKVFHKVTFTGEIPSDASESFLRDLYGPLASGIDFSWSAQNRAFMTPTALTALSGCVMGDSVEYRAPKRLKYKYNGVMSVRFKAFIDGKSVKEELLRYLICTPKLLEGCKLNDLILANTLYTTSTNILDWLDELVSIGFLDKCELTGLYEAVGALKVFIEQNSEKLQYDKADLPDASMTIIPDGEWHDTIWDLSKYFVEDFKEDNFDSFKDYCMSLYGIDEKDRVSKVDRAVISWKKLLDK